MDKLKLAHDYAMKHLEGKFYTESEQWRVAQAWEYADMMLAEQEKRTDKTRPDVLVSDEHKKESVHLNNLG